MEIFDGRRMEIGFASINSLRRSAPPPPMFIGGFLGLRTLLWLGWACCMALSAGCSVGGSAGGAKPASNNLNPYVGALGQANGQGMPLTLETTQVLNDGQQLHVFGIVTAHIPWDVSKVILRLIGLQSGQVTRETIRRLSDSSISREVREVSLGFPPPINQSSPRELKAGEKEAFYLTIPVGQISDYQLELLWGDEAQPYLVSLDSIQKKLIELRNVRVETEKSACQAAECGTKFRILLELFNTGHSPVNRVVLGVGFLLDLDAATLDPAKTVPENEEEIEISALKLAAGQGRQMRLIFEKPVPPDWADRLRPTVRVIEAG